MATSTGSLERETDKMDRNLPITTRNKTAGKVWIGLGVLDRCLDWTFVLNNSGGSGIPIYPIFSPWDTNIPLKCKNVIPNIENYCTTEYPIPIRRVCKVKYRSVTVLPALNSIFERLLAGRCMNFIVKYYQTSLVLIESFIVVRPLFAGVDGRLEDDARQRGARCGSLYGSFQGI